VCSALELAYASAVGVAAMGFGFACGLLAVARGGFDGAAVEGFVGETPAGSFLTVAVSG
jgi:hypothetical protein